jgi:hypothetical protein
MTRLSPTELGRTFGLTFTSLELANTSPPNSTRFLDCPHITDYCMPSTTPFCPPAATPHKGVQSQYPGSSSSCLRIPETPEYTYCPPLLLRAASKSTRTPAPNPVPAQRVKPKPQSWQAPISTSKPPKSSIYPSAFCIRANVAYVGVWVGLSGWKVLKGIYT